MSFKSLIWKVYWSAVWVRPRTRTRAEGTKGKQGSLHTTMTPLFAYFSLYFTFHPIVLLIRASNQVEAVNAEGGGGGSEVPGTSYLQLKFSVCKSV